MAFISTGLWDGKWAAKKWLGRYNVTIVIDDSVTCKKKVSDRIFHPETILY